jgi:hypothetical protein
MARALLLIAVVAAVAVAVAAAAGSGEDVDRSGGAAKPPATVLRMANGDGDERELVPFAAAVARLSGGTLRIEFANGWRDGEPGYEAGLIRDVAAGKADLGWAGTRAFASLGVRDFDVLHAPLLIDSYGFERRVLESPLRASCCPGWNRSGSPGSGSSRARCASRAATRRCSPRETTPARRSRTSDRSWGARRCTHSARASWRSPRAARSSPTTASSSRPARSPTTTAGPGTRSRRT